MGASKNPSPDEAWFDSLRLRTVGRGEWASWGFSICVRANEGLRGARQQDMRDATAWTGSELCPLALSAPEMTARLLGWFVERRIAAPDEEALNALTVTARRTLEDKVLEAIASSLSPERCRGLDASLADEESTSSFSGLKADPGQPNLDNILLAARRLAFVKSLALSGAAYPDLSGPVMRMLRRRVFDETAWAMRRHPDGRHHALYALFLAHRRRELKKDALILSLLR